MDNPYIEKIVVTNFKSYGAEKLEIPIGPGFIGIVGPNGAGKSNIGDAISFGLGLSTSKTMRAKNLTHLIYSHQGKRQEYAQVDIYIANPQIFGYDEFVVSRIIYQDGKSLYKLNNKNIREKDLQLILAKGGIYKEGYNIVLQGDIVKFIKMSPLERRKIIEDVAGISEYEDKKSKALEELGEAELKIRELKPLIEELEFSLEKLSQEKQKLIEYKDLSRKKYIYECLLLLKERQNLLKDLKNVEEKKLNLEKKSLDISDEIDKNTKELKDLELKIQELNEMLLPYKESSGKLSAKIQFLKEQITSKELELEKEISYKEDIEKKIDYLKKSLLEEEKELLNLEQMKFEKEKEIKTLEDNIKQKEQELLNIEKSLNLSQDEIDQIEQKEQELRQALEQNKKLLSSYIDQIQDLKSKQERYKEDINRLQEELENLLKEDEDKKLEHYKKTIEQESMSIEALKQNLNKYQTSLQNLKKELEQILIEKATLESQLRFQEDETIFKDIRGVYGKVEELISLKDETYKEAIESCAGARLSYVVVENEDVAKTCIELLKKTGQRMSFIPLNRVKPQPLPPYPRFAGYIDFAIKLIDYDKLLEPAISFVFGDTLVVKDYNVAKSLQNYRCVTLEGEVFEKTGVISGGKTKSKSLIGKKILLEKLEKVLQDYNALKERQEHLEESISKTKSLILEKEGIIAINNKYIKDIEKNTQDKKDKIQSIKDKISSGKEYINVLESKKQEILDTLEPLKEEINYLEQKLQNLELRKKDILSYYTSKEIQDLRQDIESLKKHLMEKSKELNTIELSLNSVKKEIEHIQKSISQKQEDLSLSIKNIENLNKELINLKNELSDTEEQLKHSNARFYELYEEREHLEKLQKDYHAKLGALKIEHENILQELGSITNELTKLETKLESINASLKEKEYEEGSLDESKYSMSKIKEELEHVRKALESMNDINFGAEEEYESTRERLQDYKEKLDQISKDKQAIKSMIEELDKKKLNAFMEAFNTIRKNFKEIYSKVSYQGKADLSLENQEDPFSGGISIFVKPRGKDVQYVEAMSGGEQTLAAMSLIFAIQEYKPSVFYYFDEIDAHLDEANAYLLGQMIKEKSSNTQFIVVTLRENLANFADKLIGVTNKDGISKVLTFRSLKEVS